MLLEMVLVIAITDGDTIKVLDHQNKQLKVRLASIDAPERKQPYGLKSKQALSNLIGNKRVTLDCPAIDFFKRHVCTVTLDGDDVNAAMVKQGAAWVFAKYCKIGATNYYDFQNSAKAAKIGLWNTSEYQSIEPWKWRKMKKKGQLE